MISNESLPIQEVQGQLLVFLNEHQPFQQRTAAIRCSRSMVFELSEDNKQHLTTSLSNEINRLFHLLGNASQETLFRRLSASFLGNISAVKAIPLFLDLALDTDTPDPLRQQVLWSIHQLLLNVPEEANHFLFPPIQELIAAQNESASLRTLAIQLLTHMDPARAIPSFQHILLSTHESDIAIAAIRGLSEAVDHFAILAADALLQGFESEVWERAYPVRTEIIYALIALGAYESIDTLIESFAFPEDDDDDDANDLYDFDRAIIQALGDFQDSSAVPALLNIIEESLGLLETMNPVRHREPYTNVSSLIQTAILSLRSIYVPDIIPMLLRLLSHPADTISREAIRALEPFGPEARSALSSLRDLLVTSPQQNHRSIDIYQTIAAIGPPARPALPELLEQINEPVSPKETISFAFARIGEPHPDVIEALLKTLQEEDTNAQVEACIGLLRLHPRYPSPLAILLQSLQQRIELWARHFDINPNPTGWRQTHYAEDINLLQQIIQEYLVQLWESETSDTDSPELERIGELLQKPLLLLEQVSDECPNPVTNQLHQQMLALTATTKQNAIREWRDSWEDALY